ncbi:MAG: GMC family oxidoreductase N-terminal domain-containing protein [Nannocystaceae bacterium]|nr:GMC family oxidoreductase N-terminal domain-containing protein [Nannocystaceae bacterium]
MNTIKNVVIIATEYAVAFGVFLPGCAQDEPSDSAAPSACQGAKCDSVQLDGDFEFIVVGSGAGGGPLAANLARNGHSVLLLEAGTDAGANINYQVPAFHGFSTEDPEMRWDYYVQHYDDEERGERDSKWVDDPITGADPGIFYPRSGTLGGCTAHNALIGIRPHASDWDHIAEVTGDSGWRAANMDPYFDRVAQWLPLDTADPSLVLLDFNLKKVILGAVTAFAASTSDGFFGALGATFSELYALLGRDINEVRPENEGVYPFPLTMQDGRRHSVREYLVQTVEDGFPLTIQTGAFVTRVVFADELDDGTPRATGVAFVGKERMYRADPAAAPDGELPTAQVVTASREVILSAGAFNTPQILKLSGIGPAAELGEHGIEVVAELPGVGENLQDRYEVGIVSQARSEFRILADCTPGASDDECLEEWRDGEGPYQSNGGVVTMIKRLSRELLDPDLFIFGVPGKFGGYEPGYSQDALADKSLFTWLILKAHTRNKAGYVRLRSADPRDTPEINFRYFDDGDTAQGQDRHDSQAVVKGVQLVRDFQRHTRRFMGAPLFGRFDEVWPGDEVQTAQELDTFVRDESWGHHASCSAKIGADDDPMAVLDSRFNVRGVQGLRVVDASVFPEIPGFFILMPILMVSERATDVILEDWGEVRDEAAQP